MSIKKGDIKEGEIVCKVYINKVSKQKLVSIPKDCSINPGDYVKIIKMRLTENGHR